MPLLLFHHRIKQHDRKQPDQQREKYILITEFQYFPGKCQIKRYLRQQGKPKQPQCIFFPAARVKKSLHKQKTENRECHSADGAHRIIDLIEHLTPLSGNQQSGNDRRSDMVDQHRDDRDQLQCASAESFLRHLPHRPFLPMKKRGDQAVSSISSSCMSS